MVARDVDPLSPDSRAARAALRITDRGARIALELDPATGLPVALIDRHADGREVRHDLRWSVALITEGREVEGQPFGLAYADTEDLSVFTLRSEAIRRDFLGDDELVTVATQAGAWLVDWEYRFRGSAPRLEVQLVLTPEAGGGTRTLRNIALDLALTPATGDDLADWSVHAPGSGIRASVPADAFAEEQHLAEPTFSGSGIVVVDREQPATSLLVWPFSKTEHAIHRVQTVDGALHLRVTTNVAGRIAPGERLRWGSIELDVFPHTWDALRPFASSWLRTLGIARPDDTAAWIPGATIFEVQIGTSVFWNGHEYSPYPTMRDLFDDLGRIAGLGFDVIQIMPRQPFPSYNVYDYADITTSYGDEEDLKRVVQQAHALGMKVILDILLHGVIDAEIIHRAADRVRSGPYFARLNEGTDLVPDKEFLAYQGQDYLVSWARHIIDFEAHWAGGSPGSHPLVDEHPEWFVRDSSGEIIGVYTKAFDVSNRSWQEYFSASALHLMDTLDIDGFRFDAPTYNEFPNWSPATEQRASRQQLGSVEHFARLRPRIKAHKPDAMLYTEPSGSLFRQTMDITYNYDEHWLFHAILRPDTALQTRPLGIRHARDLAEWFRDKEAALPEGAITARHIDSHDTFWWPLPGFKWRREQYGLPATRALLATWSLIGGAYMTFVGGEIGVEAEILRMQRLRDELAEIRVGRAGYDAISAADARIFAVAREHEGNVSLVLVNLSREEVTSEIVLDRALLANGATQVRDVWNDIAIAHDGAFVWQADDLAAFPLTFAPFQPRVLTIRPAVGKGW